MSNWRTNLFAAQATANAYSRVKRPEINYGCPRHLAYYDINEGQEGWMTFDRTFFPFDDNQIYPPRKAIENKRRRQLKRKEGERHDRATK